MHIITPSFPCMNSSQAVNDSTLNVMKYFLKQSADLIELQNANPQKDYLKSWDEIFKVYDFFQDY